MSHEQPQVPEADPIPGKAPELASEPGQDVAWKRVTFGQIAEPLVPAHPEPPEASADELDQAALEDPSAATRDMVDTRPTLWRIVALIVLAVVALAIVFWR